MQCCRMENPRSKSRSAIISITTFCVAGVFGLLQHIEQLVATHRELVAEVRIDRDMRRQIIELRPRPRIVLRPHHHRDRRRIQMKQRMNVPLAGGDRHGAARIQDLHLLHSHIANAQVRRHRLAFSNS